MKVPQANRSDHILVVDDDREIRDLMSRYFKRQGYRVTAVGDGREMTAALDQWAIDVIILDLMLPGEDGLALCRDLRSRSNIPVIMLTAMGEDMDRIVGLEMGADDYLAKPCNPRELLARIRAVLRRTNDFGIEPGRGGDPVFVFDGWRLDLKTRILLDANGAMVELTDGEFDLLAALVRHSQHPMSRDQLLDCVKSRWAQPFERSVDMQISRLRQKIECDAKNPQRIKTVRGAGYIFTPSVSCDATSD